MSGFEVKLITLLFLWQLLLNCTALFAAGNVDSEVGLLYSTESQRNKSKISYQSLDQISSLVESLEGSQQNCSESADNNHYYCNNDKLCHKCKEGYSMAIGSNGCIKCSNQHLMLLVLFVAAGLLLVFFIKVLNMTVSQGTINGLIFYANVVWAYESFFLPKINDKSDGYFLKVFLAWLNLDFGIETCFFNGLDCYWKTWLQFVFPLYLWAIAFAIILLSHYSQRMTNMFGTNSIQVLATLFLLSHAKFLRTIIAAILPSPANQSDYTSWAFNKDLPYCHLKHGILFGVAICVLLFLWLPYTLTLLFVQPLRSCSHFRLCRLVNKLTPLFDAYTGPFNPKSHFWVGLLCLVRGILLLVYALTHYFYETSVSSMALIITIMLLLLVLYCTGRPYRDVKRLTILYRYNLEVSFLSILEISFLLNLAGLSTGVLCTEYVFASSTKDPVLVKIAMFYTSVGIAFLQFIGILWWHIWKLIVAYRLRKARESYRDLDHNVVDTEVANAQTSTSIVIPANATIPRNTAHIRESILTDGSHS
jgi:hypothetical protein